MIEVVNVPKGTCMSDHIYASRIKFDSERELSNLKRKFSNGILKKLKTKKVDIYKIPDNKLALIS